MRLKDPGFQARLARLVSDAFRNERISFRSEDFEDALSELRLILVNPPSFEEWDEKDLAAYRKLARFAVRRIVADQRLRELSFHPSDEVKPGKVDPLKTRELWLWSVAADFEHQELGSPPYLVEFESEEVCYNAYHGEHCFVPAFDIVSIDHIGWSRQPGSSRRFRLTESNSDPASRFALHAQRSRYAEALRRAIPSYLNWLGLESLLPIDRQIVAYVRANRTHKEQIATALGIAKSTFYDAWKRLDRRGFRESREPDGTVALNYFPVFDQNLKPIDNNSWERIREKTVRELMGSDPQFYDRALHDEDFSVSDAVTWAKQMQLEAARTKMTDEIIAEFDAMQRALIKVLVEKPVVGQRLGLPQIDELLRRLGQERVKKLMFKSIRYRKPIVEILALTDIYSEYDDLHLRPQFRRRAS